MLLYDLNKSRRRAKPYNSGAINFYINDYKQNIDAVPGSVSRFAGLSGRKIVGKIEKKRKSFLFDQLWLCVESITRNSTATIG